MDLSIVGIPGSIDNDIACTDMSIGVDTTLNTIVECIDKLRDTATSHKRISIVEVMGRMRGYLAVMSGLATGADRVFIREDEIRQDELDEMLLVLQKSFAQGQRAGVIVRSEGARFSTGFLKEIVNVLLQPKRDVRETVLGHLQRGGSPTYFERVLATRMGVKAVQLLETVLPEPQIVGLNENKIKPYPLLQVLLQLQDPAFQTGLSSNAQNAFHLGRRLELPPTQKVRGLRIAVLTEGNNVSGMNMALRSIARLAINDGIEVKGIKGGFAGLLQGSESVLNLHWSMMEMKGILRRTGTLLGVSGNESVTDGKDFLTIRKQVEKMNLDGIIVIGSNMAYQCAYRMSELTQLPVVGVPADTNCNLPGTNWVIGMDSALNDIQKGIDRAVDAAQVQKKICLIHLKGRYCLCLVNLAALAGGAEQMIFDYRQSANEDPERFQNMVKKKISRLKKIVDMGKRSATVVFFTMYSENSDKTLQNVKQMIKDAGIKLDTIVIPLETSYGGAVPTAFDRVLAKRLGERALGTLQKKIQARDDTFHIVGISGKGIEANLFQDKVDGQDRGCPPEFVAELQQCFDLMAEPAAQCIGMGGYIEWIDARSGKDWKGRWTCKKCGQSQSFTFNPENMQYFFCQNENCHNYGYIRVSRRL
jgi:6-phosphofructokinase 1